MSEKVVNNRICFLEGDMSRRGGTEKMTAVLANLLAYRNKVTVISLQFSNQNLFYELSEDVEFHVLKSVPGKLRMLKKIVDIRRFIKEKNIDIIVNVDIGIGIYGILAAKGTQTKVITWEHSNYYNNWGAKVFPFLRKFAVRFSDAVVVLTEQDKQNYIKNLHPSTPIHVISNPISKKEVKYDANSKTILSAGALTPIKRFEKIVEVGKKIFVQHRDWEWVICGDGPEYESLKQAIENADLSNHIHMAGSVSDMESYYRKAAMYVMTSKMEGLPMVLLEAKSYGLPIVSFDIMTGPKDIISNGKNGYLVPSDDVEQMIKKILQLMDDVELRTKFSYHSQDDIGKFDIVQIGEKWERLIASILQQ